MSEYTNALAERREMIARFAQSLSREVAELSRVLDDEDLEEFVSCALYGGRTGMDSYYEDDCEGIVEAVDAAINDRLEDTE